MTKDRIDAVLDRIHSWPPARQEEAVHLLLAMESQDASTYELSEDERADLDAALGEVSRGEIASDAEVAAAFARKRG
ncbi:MAG: hypothetical protein K8F58_18475 [Bauldia sp.]|nr:hypothetical protein [Bauldia sp.]